MENINTDQIMTDAFRTKLQSMKSNETDSKEPHQLTTAIESLGAITVGAAKMITLSTLIWVGWHCLATIAAIPVPGYWQTLGIVAGLRSLEILLISPLIPKK